jgi:hypothetical protein
MKISATDSQKAELVRDMRALQAEYIALLRDGVGDR